MMQEQALLQAVIVNPEDDAVRLAYAAWLEGQGDPRAEFIRVQIELASAAMAFDANEAALSEIMHRKALHARQAELLAQHGRAWLGSLPALSWSFSRGFVEAVTLQGEEAVKQFLAQAETIFRLVPLRTVSLWDDPGIWESDVPPGGDDRGQPVREVRPPSPISLPTLEALVALPYLTRLAALSLHSVACRGSLSTPVQQDLIARFGDRVF